MEARTESKNWLKGFVYTIPVIGQIKIGEMVDAGQGKKRPQKNSYFNVTSQVKARGENNQPGTWIAHPLQAELLKNPDLIGEIQGESRLFKIPVKMLFDNPDLNMRERFEVFDPAANRILCAGNGEKARRFDKGTVGEVDCPGPDHCEYGFQRKCKLRGRLNVQIEGQKDVLGTFIFRTSGFNSVRTLRAKMELIHAMCGGRLAGLPLFLVIRAKMTPKGVIFYADLEARECESLMDLVNKARELANAESGESGFGRAAMETVMESMIANGAFEDTSEEAVELEDWIDPVAEGAGASGAPVGDDSPPAGTGLNALKKTLQKAAETAAAPVVEEGVPA